MDTPSGSYEPSRLSAVVDRLADWLPMNSPAAARALQPGLSSADVVVRSAAEGCQLPPEVVAFYAWHNGMRTDTDVPLVWYHRFMSLDDSFERRRTYQNPVLRAMSPLPDDWFPLFEFEGEFYFTRCQSDQAQAPIWHWSGEEPEVRLVYANLTVMLETAVDWYERGAVWVVDPEAGALDMDLRQVHSIYIERNPGGTFPYYVPDQER